jgi:hypothetical protein
VEEESKDMDDDWTLDFKKPKVTLFFYSYLIFETGE